MGSADLAAFRGDASSPTFSVRRGFSSRGDACRARANRRFNARYNAFCLVDAERALRDAAASQARWRKGEARSDIDGVPATVKDIILTKGWPTLRGSRTVEPSQELERGRAGGGAPARSGCGSSR